MVVGRRPASHLLVRIVGSAFLAPDRDGRPSNSGRDPVVDWDLRLWSAGLALAMLELPKKQRGASCEQ
jgi:hypothetical protein